MAADNAKPDPKGGSRWAPFIIFGGIFMIGAVSVSVVAVGHCTRTQPYMDRVVIPVDPNNVRPIPPPIRPVRPR